MRNLIFFFFIFLTGCAPHTVTFMSPKGISGDATINGCGQIPSTFQYEMKDSKYKVDLHYNSVYLVVEVVDGSNVEWLNNEITVLVNNESHILKAKNLIRDDRVRDPCGGFTDTFNCKTYRNYYLNIEIEALKGATQVNIVPPIPMVNKKAFEVSEIEFKEVTKTLMQAINC
ncbi:hypothetical protein [Pseudoalteromonas sp. APM04]|uniref:hypothetical protein n=1 Tax=Pseudoalteromonas sp. APM04 TaxID=2699396 RepID=UPI001FB52F00|nr:hypothetical protein [Pseudoalteromonas sp. APM04]UOB75424.1 hypothetical protein MTP24_18935 [Pseudoalteromonas sp. APM04]